MKNRSLLSLALMCLVQVHAKADVRSVTANPAADTSTQMNIGWHADLDEAECEVVYTERANAAWADAKTIAGKSVQSDIFDGIDSKMPDGKDWNETAVFLDYGVTLTGLKPDTEYMYKIKGGDDAGANVVRYFKTGGAEEFSFLWFGDVHAYTPLPNRVKNMNSVIDAALKIEPSVDFMFSTGDVVA